MFAFVVFGLVFHTKPTDWLGERLRNDLFCAELDVKPQLSQPMRPDSSLRYRRYINHLLTYLLTLIHFLMHDYGRPME